MTIICDRCECTIATVPGSVTAPQPNEFGEFICAECEENAAERAWERHCTDYEGPLPLIEQQRQAWKLK